MFYLIVISMVLGFSAFYELLEFTALKVTGIPGSVILSYQGDEWGTHSGI
jgi:putative membrane protein